MEEKIETILESIPSTEPAPDKTAKAAPRRIKKRGSTRNVGQGYAYVRATYNNTMITVTDLQGNTLAWSSAGHLGFKGPKKSTPYAATMVVKDLATKLEPVGMRELAVFVRGVGSGRESAIRGLNAHGFNVTSIKDITPIPHNGCRAPRPRRV